MKRVAEKLKTYSSPSHSAESSIKAVSTLPNATENTSLTPAINFKRKPNSVQVSNRMTMSRSLLPSRHEVCVSFTIENLCHRSGPLAAMYLNLLPCKSSVVMYNQESLMTDCLSALAKLYYSIQNRDGEVMADAMHLYGRGLSMLNDTLSRESCVITSEIIISVFCLSISEVRFYSGRNPIFHVIFSS